MMLWMKEKNIYYTLLVANAMCFIGHGSFGIITKPIWCNYFAVFGIGHQLSYQLMPVVGTLDILCGLSMLIYPTRAIAMWLVVWSLVTASLRPLSGEPFAELIERAGNFGAPLALLILVGGINNPRQWFKPLQPPHLLNSDTSNSLITSLRIIVFLLIAGHGWLNLLEKKSLIAQYTTLGFSKSGMVATCIGIFELTSAIWILIKPYRPMIFTLLLWKIFSEFFYPHYELFEWVERGGSYGTLLALWFALNPRISFEIKNKITSAYT
jgi:hypothetical protein